MLTNNGKGFKSRTCDELRMNSARSNIRIARRIIKVGRNKPIEHMPGCSSCILYARGREFDVDRFLERSSLQPDQVSRRDDPGLLGKRRLFSGLSFFLGNADRRVSWHVARALKFMREKSPELRRLRRASGVAQLRLEFCSYRRTEGIQSDLLPSELLTTAGSLGIDIEWSVYPTKTEYEKILGEKIPRRAPAWARRFLKQSGKGTKTSANHAAQRTGASGFAQRQIRCHPRRRVADLCR